MNDFIILKMAQVLRKNVFYIKVEQAILAINFAQLNRTPLNIIMN